MTTNNSNPTILLIPGHWLGAWAWDEVVNHLATLGQRGIPLTLPGLDESDPDRITRTLEDQVAAIERVATSNAEPVVIVAHSGANAPVSLFLDQHPKSVSRVIWVDSGPATPGTAFAPDFPEEIAALPLPSFDVLAEEASMEGLSTGALERFWECAVSEPGTVLRQIVELTSDARFDVPTTLVCCSIPSSQVIELAEAAHPMFAEVANLKSVEYVDLPTGHWPMWSRPADLANVLVSVSSKR